MKDGILQEVAEIAERNGYLMTFYVFFGLCSLCLLMLKIFSGLVEDLARPESRGSAGIGYEEEKQITSGILQEVAEIAEGTALLMGLFRFFSVSALSACSC